jgi:NAD(P)-dependent dehydrogenase (short-subunit alcohol dehydrogenase family)
MAHWFITGGTPGGFGMAYAEAALERGDRVTLTVRRPELLEGWAPSEVGRALVVPLDVTDRDQIRDAVARAEDRFGGIDVLVNNAGRGWIGSAEGMDEAAVRATLELNFFSVMAVTRAVLPGMRARRGGWVVMMSSAAGLRPVTGFGYYSAAKHALEGATAALRSEVADFGIRVLVVEPGAFRTGAYSGFADDAVNEDIAEYASMLRAVQAGMLDQHGRQPGDPRRGVRAVLEAMERPDPPRRLVLGAAAFDAVTGELESALADIRSGEASARAADFDG